MGNLKIDLINKVKNDQYYNEMELSRLAQDATMNYKSKISEMTFVIGNIALGNAVLALVEQYFKEPEIEQTPVVEKVQAE